MRSSSACSSRTAPRRASRSPSGRRWSGTATRPSSAPGSATASGSTARSSRPPGCAAIPPSCCWTRTRPRSRARSTGTRRCSPTASTTRTGPVNDLDSGPHMPKGVVTSPFFDWAHDRPPRTPWNETVVYEVHVKGFTQRHPGIPEELRGTYAGLAHPAALEYLSALGRHRGGAAAGAPVHPGLPPRRARAAQLLGLQLDRLPGAAQRLQLLGAGRRPGAGVQADGQGAARGRHRGDPRRGLQPHRRGQPPGPDPVVQGSRQPGLLPARRRRSPLLLRHDRDRQQPQPAPPARAAADHGLAALLGHRDARGRLPVRPRLRARARVPRGGPPRRRSSTSSSRIPW